MYIIIKDIVNFIIKQTFYLFLRRQVNIEEPNEKNEFIEEIQDLIFF